MKDRKKADFFTRQPVKFTPYFDRERVKEVLEKYAIPVPNLKKAKVITSSKFDTIANDLCEPEEQPTLTDRLIEGYADHNSKVDDEDEPGEQRIDTYVWSKIKDAMKFARQFYEGKDQPSDDDIKEWAYSYMEDNPEKMAVDWENVYKGIQIGAKAMRDKYIKTN